MLDEIDDLQNVGSGRWKYLVHMSKLLSDGRKMFELEYLVNKIEEPAILADYLPPEFINKGKADHLSSGFINKGKRSPRRKKADFKRFLSENLSLNYFGKKSGLKLIFKINLRSVSNVVCNQKPVSRQVTFKKRSSKSPNKNPRKRMKSEEAEGTSSSKRAKKIHVPMDPAQDLSESCKNYIHDCGGDPRSVILVIQKELTKTDLSKNHGRLSMPYKKVRNEFLKPSEVDQLTTEKKGIQTALIQPCLEECKISLRNWKSNSEYVLVGDWNNVCRTNKLREGMQMQLWSFRRNSSQQLCFALVRVD